MIQRLGAFLVVSSLLGVGCGVGDDSGDMPVCSDAFKVTGTFVPGTPARPATLPSPDPDGTYPPFTGCWPVGTWNFTVALDPDATIQDFNDDGTSDRCGQVADTKAATFDASYSFVVERKDDATLDYVDSYSLTGSTTSGDKTLWNDKVVYKLDVSEGGSGQCEGGISIYSKDGKTFWNLHPALTDTTIAGTGDFFYYKKSRL